MTEIEGESAIISLSYNLSQTFKPAQAWCGSDLIITSYGKGKIILSTLQIIKNLDKDPIADKIFYNLISYATTQKNVVMEFDEEIIRSELKIHFK